MLKIRENTPPGTLVKALWWATDLILGGPTGRGGRKRSVIDARTKRVVGSAYPSALTAALAALLMFGCSAYPDPEAAPSSRILRWTFSERTGGDCGRVDTFVGELPDLCDYVSSVQPHEVWCQEGEIKHVSLLSHTIDGAWVGLLEWRDVECSSNYDVEGRP